MQTMRTGGALYLIGTPIGNLGDLSPRAAEVLAACDFIAAEDTRVSGKLLAHLGVKKPMLSYFEHNKRERGELILQKLQAGERVALMTDAGMPAISDPGEDLVRLCVEHGIPVCCVPGPSAVISALAMSGLPTGRFCFEGFLTTSKSGRRAHLEALREETRTMVFYEAPHKLVATLRDMLACWGDRRVTLCREMTKLHEENLYTTLSAALERFEQEAPRGEFVLVVEGAPAPAAETAETQEAAALARARALVEAGLSRRDAARQAAEETGQKKNRLYALLLEE